MTENRPPFRWSRRIPSDWRVLAALGFSAAYFAFGVLWLRARRDDPGLPANDIYAQFYPNIVYAWHSISSGAGVLWNPYQDCGQPFFAVSQTGLLYPVNLVFALLGRESAVLASVVINLGIAGTGTFLLCRELGLGAAVALSGALAYQLGGTAVQLAAWSPMHIAPYAWLPVAMWRTECLVRQPGARRGILLGLVLTMQLLPGFPQIVFFTYQLIALRVAWALLFERSERLRLIAAVGGALVLPALLAAVQLLPSMEVAWESVRGQPVDLRDVGPSISWGLLRGTLSSYGIPGNLLLVPMATAGLFAVHRGAGRPASTFYVLVAVLYLILSLGPGTPLYTLYSGLPLGTAFRGSGRLLWVTSFALAVLVGFGGEVILEAGVRHRLWQVAALGALFLAAFLADQLTQGGVRWVDCLLGIVVMSASIASGWPRLAPAARSVLPVVVFINCAMFGTPPLFKLQQGDLYGASAPAFDFVRARLTPQDRVLVVGKHLWQYPLTPKTASLYRVPSIFDYEPQASRRYAHFFAFMRTGHPMQHLDDWYWVFDDLMPPTLQGPLLNLTAARYLLVDPDVDRTRDVLGSGVRLLAERGSVRIYENVHALRRVRYVPAAEVTPDDDVLVKLAASSVDPLRVALVDRPPRSGFLGTNANASGTAEVVGNAPEHVAVRVEAEAPGFLFMADEYFPGWVAHVNGRVAEILRADYTFRLVEVPIGRSEVVFDYRPRSVRVGTAISAATLVALAAALARSQRRRRCL